MDSIAIGILVVLLVAVVAAMTAMKLNMRLTRPIASEPQPFVMQGEPNQSREKIEKHVRRFTLALEQCEKGPTRRAELQQNLDYWAMRLAAEDLKEGE